MYKSKYDIDFGDETSFAKKAVLWIVALTVILSIGTWIATRSVVVADNAIIHYEEFQEIWNTCQKINTDLGTLRAIPENDQMFAQFSKAAVIAGKKQQLSRWVEEYNAKSKMWNRSLWKSNKLPYQLSVDDFANFGGVR